MVVEDVGDGRSQAAVVLLVGLGVGLQEEVELQLRAEHGREAELGGAIDLTLQDLPRRGIDRRAVEPDDVAENERRRLEPRDPPERRHVGREAEVAVPAFPVRHLVPGNRIHLHVDGEQVVAPFHAVLGHVLLEEEGRVQAFSQQPALHVREGDDDGVDLSCRRRGLQLVDGQHGASLSSELPPNLDTGGGEARK